MIENRKFGGYRFDRVARGMAIVALGGAPLLFTPASQAADAGYIKIVPAQGAALDGSSKDPAHMNWISVSSVASGDLNGDAQADRESSSPSVSELTASNSAMKTTAPRDAASGMTTGRRMHKPFVIVKEVDKASPLLVKACASGQHLGEVDVDLPSGKYKLTDVVVSSDTKSTEGGKEMESVSFTYQKIEIEK
jgi:type VI protein secretion system component Hcp